MNRHFRVSLFWFLIAYIVVGALATALSLSVSAILGLPLADELGISRIQDPGFILVNPYILVLNVVLWPLFAALSYRKRGESLTFGEALRTGLFWLGLALVLDLVFFVLIPSPISLSAKEFYVDNEPVLGLTYLSVFAAHLGVYGFYRFIARKKA